MFVAGCLECHRLFGEAAAATTLHLEAVGRLQVASMEDGVEDLKALQEIVDKTRTEREASTDAYRLHELMHVKQTAA